MKKNLILHPFLIAIFPVFFLFSQNINVISIKQLWSPLLVTLVASLILFVASWLLFRNVYKAAIFTSGFILLFVSYQPFRIYLQHSFLSGSELTRHRYQILVFLITFGLISYSLVKAGKNLPRLNQIFNIMALALVVPSAGKIMWYFWLGTGKEKAELYQPKVSETKPLPEQVPDIYHLVFDGYARHDVLKEIFNYDNEPFLKALKSRGFYIARESTSNYIATRESVASTLNSNYLHNLKIYPRKRPADNNLFTKLVSDSKIRQNLESYGYKFVNFASGYSVTEIKNADHFLKSKMVIEFDEFDNALLASTPIPELAELYLRTDFQYNNHRETELFPFRAFKNAVALESPKFVFMHHMSLHPPFVIDANGQSIQPNRPFWFADANEYITSGGTEAEYLECYKNQLIYTNQKIIETIDIILKNSKSPPVIVLQGDHSTRIHLNILDINKTRMRESFSILNAYYFPKGDSTGVYQNITPVNTFRIIQNKYFYSDLPLLPDRNFYTTPLQLEIPTDVTEQVKNQKLK